MFRYTVRFLATNSERKIHNDFVTKVFPTSHHMDKEAIAQKQQFTSLDCVMDPSIALPSLTTWKGIRKRFSLYLAMKRLMDRRPDITTAVLQQRYIEFKKLSNSSLEKDWMSLSEYTTANEAQRITAEQREKYLSASLNRAKSWKDIIKTVTVPTYHIQVDAFEPVGSFYGSMTHDDWLQLNFEARIHESDATTQSQRVEYPVIEVLLTDGVLRPNQSPPRIVAIMDKHGSRAGKDGMDAVTLRKALSSNSWFS